MSKRQNSLKDREPKKLKTDTLDSTPLHPALLALQKDPNATPAQLTGLVPKFATTKANIRMQEKKLKKQQEAAPIVKPAAPATNPYLSERGAPVRFKRKMHFAEPGTFIKEAEKLRAETELDDLKRQIAEAIVRTGLEDHFDLAADEAIRTVEPPLVEWWDAPLKDPSLLTNLIQHPIVVTFEEKLEPMKMMLTKKERKKLRRLKRAEILNERRDKIRMGLLPPEQPKLKMSNFMKVMGSDAIQDPTQVEQLVKQQMAQRQAAAKKHDDQLKLTDEQKREKKRLKLLEDSEQVFVAVFKVKSVSHPSHRFKMSENAKDYNLTGVCISYSLMNLVVVEGGPKGINQYKKLMLRRINWSDEKRTEMQNSIDCSLVWEGMVTDRAFRYFGFKQFETDLTAREFLQAKRVAHYWDSAKNYSLE